MSVITVTLLINYFSIQFDTVYIWNMLFQLVMIDSERPPRVDDSDRTGALGNECKQLQVDEYIRLVEWPDLTNDTTVYSITGLGSGCLRSLDRDLRR